CGRKSHRVISENRTFFTIPCEAIFNIHPRVARSALVGVGEPMKQKPVICIELKKESMRTDKKALLIDLTALAARHEMTRPIDTILFHRAFPVDIRHNSKIFREKLAAWAGQKLK
ncbi:MAG: peptide synthase, partial [Desulfobacterales bacterium]